MNGLLLFFDDRERVRQVIDFPLLCGFSMGLEDWLLDETDKS
jgi:hypothetical protein